MVAETAVKSILKAPTRLLFLGAPGSGKGTITAKLMKCVPEFNSISSGDILRNEMNSQSEIGTTISRYISEGKLLPDTLMIPLIKDRVVSLARDFSTANSWILDGFPRTLIQAKALDEMLNECNSNLTHVIELDVPESAILRRVQERYIHLKSGRVYNMSYNPPKVPGYDDVTGEPLVRREDDNVSTLQRRLEQYRELTAPLKRYYQDRNLLTSVAGETSDTIFEKLTELLCRSQSE